MQGTAADVIKVAMVAIHRRLRGRAGAARSSSRCTTSCCSRCQTRGLAVKSLVREEMSRAYPLDPPLGVDVGVGDDWNDAKAIGSRP
jgi:DNA polymerase-1